MKTICITRLHLVRLLVASALALSALTVPTASAQGAGTITVNDFADYRVFQRDIGGTSKSVTISGTSSNVNWSQVEARVLWHSTDTAVVDWTTIDETPGGETFSGDLTVPEGGWYDVEIRALETGGTVLGSSRGRNKWGVGMIILVIGQSNMSGRGQPPFAIATSDLAVNYSNAGRWEHLADPYDDESPPGAVDSDNDVISTNNVGGSMTPGIANSLLSTFDFPIAFVPAAKGGSNLYVNGSNYGWAYRNPSNHFDTSTLYGQSITKAQNVGGVELIIMHQGEADLGDGRTEANYEADFATMIGNYRQDLYSDIPIFICQLGTAGGGTDAGAVGIRNAQHDVDNGTSIFMSATAMDLPRFDTWHYNTPQLTVIGSRMANAIKYYFGQSTYYRGPSINSAFFSEGNRNQVIVSLHHRGGTDIAPATGITGFEVFDNGSSITIQSAARYAADAVRLTLSRSISSGHTVTLRYLYGRTPNVSGLVKDDSPLALPLENTTANVTVSSGVLGPTISGNAGVGGAALTYDGGSTTADAATGLYSFTVPYNWGGTVTPSLAGYTFTPPSRDYANVTSDQIDQDYTVDTAGPLCYVNASAVGPGTGNSWAEAYADLQSALTNVACTEIWVAAGTYTPTSGADRTISFALKNGVAIYGGFDGIELARSERNPAANVTYLSGDIGTPSVNFDNSYHVVDGSSTDGTAVLDGFTVTNGNANGEFVLGGGLGGGMYNDGGSPTLTNIAFSHNSAISGGGMANGGSPTLTNVTFDTNSATSNGGGMSNGGSPTLTNVTFNHNSAQAGGGMYNDGGSPTLTNVTFSGNSAQPFGYGGAMKNFLASPIIKDSIFWGDLSAPFGPEVYNAAGGPTFYDSIVQGSGGSGAGWESDLGTDGGGNFDADPVLGPLADNGGYTQTMALGPGSAAIDAGNDDTCADTDQRDVSRPQGPHCDIGAFEATAVTVDVSIAGALMGSYGIVPSTGDRESYTDANNGPVQVSTDGAPVVAAERIIYTGGAGSSDHKTGTITSYSELMGFPANQLTTEYWVPWYNNHNFWTQLRFGNPSTTQSTTISVYLGTTLLGSYPLAPSQSTRVDYTEVNGGPLRMVSSGGVPFIGSERIIYSDGNGSIQRGDHTSYYELMGIPGTQLSTDYWIPIYDYSGMWTQLRFANPSTTQSTTVSVYLGSTLLGSYPMGPATSTRVDYTGVNDGPIHIMSSGGVPIIASERVIYSAGGVARGTHVSYSELNALPASQLSTAYFFPSYSNPNSDTSSEVRFANTSATESATVEVRLAGALKGTYTLAPLTSARADYAGQDSGPLEVRSTNAVPIVAALRVIASVSGAQTSYSEVMGYPESQLTSTQLFPWYNNYNFDTQIRMAVP